MFRGRMANHISSRATLNGDTYNPSDHQRHPYKETDGFCTRLAMTSGLGKVVSGTGELGSRSLSVS